MQYLGGKAGPGARIASLCSERLGENSLFVDMFCGSLNVVRHIQNPRRLAVDACGPLGPVDTDEEFRRVTEL